MPQYFFHIALELFREANLTNVPAEQNQQTSPVNKILQPFIYHKRPRATRDPSYDPNHSRRSVPESREVALPDRPAIAAQTKPSSADDLRLRHIFIEGTDMNRQEAELTTRGEKHSTNQIEKGLGTATSGLQTKGRYVPLEQPETEAGWGIVHLYRDAQETPELYIKKPPDLWMEDASKKQTGTPHPPPQDDDCTTLCILAVPSYLTPSDFLAFVGQGTRNEVTHFRMIRTERANRYMVLMKFRHGKRAREWQHEWNGRVFNSMEPETCHVVFLKSVEIFQNPSTDSGVYPSNSLATDTTYPKMTPDPFTTTVAATPSATATAKPFAPPTPSLLELPTCPVCLERMDETTGLLTILCQHVFHCTCLQKWSGGGCPVCRYTHDDFSSRAKSKSKKYLSGLKDEYDVYGDDDPLECQTCHIENNLWQCLICGKVGCGRYEAKHAFAHYEASGHSFAMDLESKRVWDYGGDGYVHRIIQDGATAGEKLVELPGRRETVTALQAGDDDMVKMDNVALEYTHLLTSQLESQRVYFEGVVERAVDKAAKASADAARALEDSKLARKELEEMRSQFRGLSTDTVPSLERERDRLEKKSKRFEELSRELQKNYVDEKSMTKNLMNRIQHLTDELEELKGERGAWEKTVAELKEENHDLMMSITGMEKLKEMSAAEGGEDIVKGTVGVPEVHPGGSAKRRKGKGRR